MFEFITTGLSSETVSNGVTYACFPVAIPDKLKVREVLGNMNKDKIYIVTVKEKKRERSLAANAYFWKLATKLADVLKTTKVEIYREFIRDIDGTYTIVTVDAKVAASVKEYWEEKGLGWICEDLGEYEICIPDTGEMVKKHDLMCHKGSSKFNSKQMSQLIDLVVQECKSQGIQTLDELELEALVEGWGKK